MTTEGIPNASYLKLFIREGLMREWTPCQAVWHWASHFDFLRLIIIIIFIIQTISKAHSNYDLSVKEKLSYLKHPFDSGS